MNPWPGDLLLALAAPVLGVATYRRWGWGWPGVVCIELVLAGGLAGSYAVWLRQFWLFPAGSLISIAALVALDIHQRRVRRGRRTAGTTESGPGFAPSSR